MAATLYAIGSQNLTSPTVTNDRPLSLADMGVSSGLQLDAINKKLEIESTLDEIYYDLGADVVSVGQKVQVPNAMVMRLNAASTGARTVTVPMLLAQKGLLRVGSAQQQSGYERDFNLKYAKFYYNEYSYAIAGESWGVNYNDVNQYGLYSQIQPMVSKVLKETYGQWMREASLETYAYNLEAAPVTLTQEWNNNWFVANTDFGSQPAYDSTLATFTANIVSALTAAATGTNGVNANIDVNYLLSLEHYAANTKRIKPLMVGGRKTYVCVLPSSQWQLLRSMDEGQLGKVWVDVSSLSKEEASYPGVVGRIGSLLLIEDQRYPTITESGGAISVEYVFPGNTDSRNTSVYDSSTNKSWDIGFLYGQAAITSWEVRKPHFETDKNEYGKIYGEGAFGEMGIQLTKYDVDSETDTSRANYGSIVLAMTAPSIVTTA